MTAQAPVLRQHGNAYNIFILVLTIYSLALMVLLILPLDEGTHELVNFYDNAICVIFLIDFVYNLTGSKPKRAYFISARGWLDLIGSIPSLGFLPLTALLRLARLSRLSRITRQLGGQAGKDLVLDVLRNRSQYATFITILLAGMVLSTASILILHEESRSPGRQHHDRWRRALVGHRDDHHRRLRRLLPGHDPRPHHRGVRDVRGHRHHRRAGQHPREPPGRADGAMSRHRDEARRRGRSSTGRGRRRHRARSPSRRPGRSPTSWPAFGPRWPFSGRRSRPCGRRSGREQLTARTRAATHCLGSWSALLWCFTTVAAAMAFARSDERPWSSRSP